MLVSREMFNLHIFHCIGIQMRNMYFSLEISSRNCPVSVQENEKDEMPQLRKKNTLLIYYIISIFSFHTRCATQSLKRAGDMKTLHPCVMNATFNDESPSNLVKVQKAHICKLKITLSVSALYSMAEPYVKWMMFALGSRLGRAEQRCPLFPPQSAADGASPLTLLTLSSGHSRNMEQWEEGTTQWVGRLLDVLWGSECNGPVPSFHCVGLPACPHFLLTVYVPV